GKRLELLREVCGKPSAIAILLNPDDPPAVNALRETTDAASQMGFQVTVVEARTPDEIAPGFEKIVQARRRARRTAGQSGQCVCRRRDERRGGGGRRVWSSDRRCSGARQPPDRVSLRNACPQQGRRAPGRRRLVLVQPACPDRYPGNAPYGPRR